MRKTNITPSQLQIFVTIAEVGSLTTAGEVLNLTQSGVSHALASLEKTLGVSLFHRERSGVTLTNAGQELLISARTLLAQVDVFEQSAALIVGEARGNLSIGCFPSVGSKILPELVRQFLDEYQHVSINIQQGTDQDVLEWLATQQVDIGFVTLPISQFEICPFMEDEFVALLPDTHPYAYSDGVPITELVDDPFILSTGGCEALVSAMFATAGYRPNTKHTARDINTILAFINAGLGISIVPILWLTENTPYVRLDPPVVRRMGLAVRALETASPLAKKFIDFAQQFQYLGNMS